MVELAIETSNLVKVFKSGKRIIRAIDNVSIKVPKGVIFGLLGPNGAGKTTLLSILIGLTLPTSGSGKVLGYDIIKESIEIRKRTGVLPENFGFYEHLTPVENLRLIAKLNDIPENETEKRIKEILDLVGLREHTRKRVGEFSRGMKQRLGLASALLKDPELLLLDEPTVGIDPKGVKEFRDLVVKLTREGKTVVISTHLLRELGSLCNFVAIIREGRILIEGSVSDIINRFMKEKGFLYKILFEGELEDSLLQELRSLSGVESISIRDQELIIKCNTDQGEKLYETITKYRLQLREFTLVKPTLEEIFLSYLRGESS